MSADERQNLLTLVESLVGRAEGAQRGNNEAYLKGLEACHGVAALLYPIFILQCEGWLPRSSDLERILGRVRSLSRVMPLVFTSVSPWPEVLEKPEGNRIVGVGNQISPAAQEAILTHVKECMRRAETSLSDLSGPGESDDFDELLRVFRCHKGEMLAAVTLLVYLHGEGGMFHGEEASSIQARCADVYQRDTYY